MSWYAKAQSGVRIWLDDERDPKDPTTQNLFRARGDEVWVRTAADAIRLLEQGNVISISLDNDLGSTKSKKEGQAVANWIERNAHAATLPRLQWFIHSKNPVRSNSMEIALSNADRFWDEHDAGAQ